MCRVVLLLLTVLPMGIVTAPPPLPSPVRIDAQARRLMQAAHARGMALAVIDAGKVVHVAAYGERNAGDERRRRLPPRLLLNHGSGFANFAFLEPDGTLKFHFDPGSRYGYSSEGLILLQFVLERGRPGRDIGALMQRRVFDRFDMPRTSMMWREDFAANLADGRTADGTPEPHDERSRVRAAGSMDTTIADMANFAAGHVRGEGLSAAMRQELVRPQLPITTASQFPTLQRNCRLRSGAGTWQPAWAWSRSAGRRAPASTRAATMTRWATPWCASSRASAAW